MKKILIVDDDDEFRLNLSEVLQEAGYRTDSASSAQEAVAQVEAREFDIVLLDYMMPKMSGMDVLVTIRRLRPKAKVIMLTAFATVENAVEAMKRGASDYVMKLSRIEAILTTISRALEEARYEECLHKLDFDYALHSLTNPIRRNIIKLLNVRESMRMMEITRELGIEDHTKVIFHMRLLKEAGIIEQNEDKSYSLAKEGCKAVECLRTLENYLHS